METKDKIYLAGKVTGDPCYKMKFEAGVRYLVASGWKRESIVNPAQLVPAELPWPRAMWRCLKLLWGCEWVALLPDWAESRGARLERLVAKVTMKWIIYVKP